MTRRGVLRGGGVLRLRKLCQGQDPSWVEGRPQRLREGSSGVNALKNLEFQVSLNLLDLNRCPTSLCKGNALSVLDDDTETL